METKFAKEYYLIKAIYEWCMDNSYTPFILVYVNKYAQVPQEYVGDNKLIVLDISPEAVDKLQIDHEWVNFSARFNGVEQKIKIPLINIMSIMASEIKDGINLRSHPPEDDEFIQKDGKEVEKKAPIFKIIK